MAIYFPNQVPSTGQKAGEAFSGGIGNALNMLAQQKLSHVQQRHKATQIGHALESLGIPAHVAMLPEPVQQAFIKQHLAAPQQQAFAEALSGLLGGGEQQQAAPVQQGQQIAPQLQQAMAPRGQQPQQQMQQPGMQQARTPGISIPKGINQQQAMQLAQLGLKKQSLEHQKQQFMTKQELEQQKRQDRKQMHWDKETAPAYKEIEDLAKAASDSDIRLGRMEELNEGGGLNSTAFETVLRGLEGILPFGMKLDLTALRSADSQEFNKLSTDFLKDAKKFFGSRVTDSEIKLFLKTVPQLSNSPEGRNRVIQNLRLFNEAAKVRATVADNIVEENGGDRPYNFKSLVEKRAKKQLDDIAQTFRLGVRKPKKAMEIPEGFEDFAQAQSTLGSL